MNYNSHTDSWQCGYTRCLCFLLKIWNEKTAESCKAITTILKFNMNLWCIHMSLFHNFVESGPLMHWCSLLSHKNNTCHLCSSLYNTVHKNLHKTHCNTSESDTNVWLSPYQVLTAVLVILQKLCCQKHNAIIKPSTSEPKGQRNSKPWMVADTRVTQLKLWAAM